MDDYEVRQTLAHQFEMEKKAAEYRHTARIVAMVIAGLLLLFPTFAAFVHAADKLTACEAKRSVTGNDGDGSDD